MRRRFTISWDTLLDPYPYAPIEVQHLFDLGWNEEYKEHYHSVKIITTLKDGRIIYGYPYEDAWCEVLWSGEEFCGACIKTFTIENGEIKNYYVLEAKPGWKMALKVIIRKLEEG